MGDFKDDWGKEEVEKPLKAAYDLYPELKGPTSVSFKDRYTFKHINFNTIIENQLKAKRDAYKQMTNLGPNAENVLEALGGLKQKIDKLGEHENLAEDSFYMTHWADVFYYLAEFQTRSRIHSLVYASITEAVSKHLAATDNHGTTSIIAHSLGTSVMTRALQRLIEDDTYFLDNFGKFRQQTTDPLTALAVLLVLEY